VTKSVESNVSIFTRIFDSKTDHAMPVQPSGLLEDDGGLYCEESQDYSSSQSTIRIEKDRPGDWYVRDSFCEVDGLNDADRADDVAKFFAGSHRWLHLERRPNGRNGPEDHRGHRNQPRPQREETAEPPWLHRTGAGR
jgi:hypothetical protein